MPTTPPASDGRRIRRGPYRGDRRAELEEIERKRRRLGVTINEFADRAGLDRSTLLRIRATGRAFVRTIKALRNALREIEKQRKQQQRMFRVEGHDADV